MPPIASRPESLRVAAAQMKFAGDIQGNLGIIESLAAQAARQRADVVLFPECATTGYAFDFTRLKRVDIRRALGVVGDAARAHDINLLVGSAVFGPGGKLYNGLIHFDRSGHAAYCYAKCQLHPMDRKFFTPGNAIALFEIDGAPATAIICHERRYPELVRLGVMAGAQVIFHPNAGLDSLAVSKAKRGGWDGIVARAFENAAYYVFANSVGRQSQDRWSAGDSKIVAPDERVLALANNRDQALITATLDLSAATGSYAQRGMVQPKFLAQSWRQMVQKVKRQARHQTALFDLPFHRPSARRRKAGR